jgi:predicted nucleotidyltransferase component of viral defense system
MSRAVPANLAHSTHQRLLNKAKADGRPFNELLQYYAMERFLYRLSRSKHADKYILKGAMMLRVWQAPMARPTMDIDMLGRTDNDAGSVVSQFREICSADVEPDGLAFDAASVESERIAEEADYEGLRLRIRGNLGNARVSIQVDIGFGDVVFPPPEYASLPPILSLVPPRLRCYSRESVIAEKFEAMVKHGELNSRMKDFYDIRLMASQFDFDGPTLLTAIGKTFGNRNVGVPESIAAFTDAFAADRQQLWRLFRKRLPAAAIPEDFAEVVAFISSFLQPLASALASGQGFDMQWSHPGPWLTK